jgi:hypothetical protein
LAAGNPMSCKRETNIKSTVDSNAALTRGSVPYPARIYPAAGQCQ